MFKDQGQGFAEVIFDFLVDLCVTFVYPIVISRLESATRKTTPISFGNPKNTQELVYVMWTGEICLRTSGLPPQVFQVSRWGKNATYYKQTCTKICMPIALKLLQISCPHLGDNGSSAPSAWLRTLAEPSRTSLNAGLHAGHESRNSVVA